MPELWVYQHQASFRPPTHPDWLISGQIKGQRKCDAVVDDAPHAWVEAPVASW